MTHRPPNPASQKGLQKALAALYDPTPSDEDPLATRERLRIEAEAQARRQGVLLLKPAP